MTLEEKADQIVARFRQELEEERIAREAQLAGNLEWLIQKRLNEQEWKLFRSWIERNRGLLKDG